MAGQLKASPLCQSALPAAPEGPSRAGAADCGGDSNTRSGEEPSTPPEGTRRLHQCFPGVAVSFPREGVPLVTARPMTGDGDGFAGGRIRIVSFWDYESASRWDPTPGGCPMGFWAQMGVQEDR